MPADRLPESVWWLDDSGQVFAAAEAMNAALSVALGTRAPLRLYRLPEMRRLQERGLPLGRHASLPVSRDHAVLRVPSGGLRSQLSRAAPHDAYVRPGYR